MASWIYPCRGVTQRRWLSQANPALARFITEDIGTTWITDLGQRDVEVMCQVNGTFLFTPDQDSAKKVVDRLAPKDKPVGPVASPLLTAFKALPKTSDAYGVVINQKGAFSALLKSINNDQT